MAKAFMVVGEAGGAKDPAENCTSHVSDAHRLPNLSLSDSRCRKKLPVVGGNICRPTMLRPFRTFSFYEVARSSVMGVPGDLRTEIGSPGSPA
jgi:hypothetical protein